MFSYGFFMRVVRAVCLKLVKASKSKLGILSMIKISFKNIET